MVAHSCPVGHGADPDLKHRPVDKAVAPPFFNKSCVEMRIAHTLWQIHSGSARIQAKAFPPSSGPLTIWLPVPSVILDSAILESS